MSDVVKMLEDLADGWRVTLEREPNDDRWTLVIYGPLGPAFAGESVRDRKQHTYRGTLASVVNRAWAGEPGDVKPGRGWDDDSF